MDALDSLDRTVLCEWSGVSHLNYGDGPLPDAQSFINAVVKIM